MALSKERTEVLLRSRSSEEDELPFKSSSQQNEALVMSCSSKGQNEALSASSLSEKQNEVFCLSSSSEEQNKANYLSSSVEEQHEASSLSISSKEHSEGLCQLNPLKKQNSISISMKYPLPYGWVAIQNFRSGENCDVLKPSAISSDIVHESITQFDGPTSEPSQSNEESEATCRSHSCPYKEENYSPPCLSSKAKLPQNSVSGSSSIDGTGCSVFQKRFIEFVHSQNSGPRETCDVLKPSAISSNIAHKSMTQFDGPTSEPSQTNEESEATCRSHSCPYKEENYSPRCLSSKATLPQNSVSGSSSIDGTGCSVFQKRFIEFVHSQYSGSRETCNVLKPSAISSDVAYKSITQFDGPTSEPGQTNEESEATCRSHSCPYKEQNYSPPCMSSEAKLPQNSISESSSIGGTGCSGFQKRFNEFVHSQYSGSRETCDVLKPSAISSDIAYKSITQFDGPTSEPSQTNEESEATCRFHSYPYKEENYSPPCLSSKAKLPQNSISESSSTGGTGCSGFQKRFNEFVHSQNSGSRETCDVLKPSAISSDITHKSMAQFDGPTSEPSQTNEESEATCSSHSCPYKEQNYSPPCLSSKATLPQNSVSGSSSIDGTGCSVFQKRFIEFVHSQYSGFRETCNV